MIKTLKQSKLNTLPDDYSDFLSTELELQNNLRELLSKGCSAAKRRYIETRIGESIEAARWFDRRFNSHRYMVSFELRRLDKDGTREQPAITQAV